MCSCAVADPCPTICNPVDCSSLGSSVHGILQARVLEWGAIAFSVGSPTSLQSSGKNNCKGKKKKELVSAKAQSKFMEPTNP